MKFYRSYQQFLIIKFIKLNHANFFFNKKKVNFLKSFNLTQVKLLVSHSSLISKKGENFFRILDSLIVLRKITHRKSCVKFFKTINPKNIDALLETSLTTIIVTQSILIKDFFFLYLNFLKFLIYYKFNLNKKLNYFSTISLKLTKTNILFNNMYILNLKYFFGCYKDFAYLQRKLCLNFFFKPNNFFEKIYLTQRIILFDLLIL